MRGIACKCPRCGKGKLYAGFLDLRPRAEAGLAYYFVMMCLVGVTVFGAASDGRLAASNSP